MEYLEHVAPGKKLADALWDVDRREFNGHDLVHLIRARQRLISQLQAELYADMAELA